MKSIFLFMYGYMFLFATVNAQKTETAIEILIKHQIAKYPKMEARDLYKFLHQAAMGSEHAVKDTNAVKAWLKNEIAGLDTSITDDLIEQLSPDGSLVRINLRPFLKSGENPEHLLRAFISTANNYRGNKDTLVKYLTTAKELIKRKEIPVDEYIFFTLVNELEKSGYPAIHHSTAYAISYKPAYRVVSKKYFTTKQ
ncbi:MAG: hypothetical protein FD143_2671 [Ignavibacteria bacterium]|nr:MAG: hypothetical protein FD143_2671 [Ignavibacteria bacterium]KAF0156139.1 MAG: hypothetical protein FD188_3030 [Ignavibacteria bacterium]